MVKDEKEELVEKNDVKESEEDDDDDLPSLDNYSSSDSSLPSVFGEDDDDLPTPPGSCSSSEGKLTPQTIKLIKASVLGEEVKMGVKRRAEK